MTPDHIFVVVTLAVFTTWLLRSISAEHVRDLASMGDHRRAMRRLGRVHRATIASPPAHSSPRIDAMNDRP